MTKSQFFTLAQGAAVFFYPIKRFHSIIASFYMHVKRMILNLSYMIDTILFFAAVFGNIVRTTGWSIPDQITRASTYTLSTSTGKSEIVFCFRLSVPNSLKNVRGA